MSSLPASLLGAHLLVRLSVSAAAHIAARPTCLLLTSLGCVVDDIQQSAGRQEVTIKHSANTHQVTLIICEMIAISHGRQ